MSLREVVASGALSAVCCTAIAVVALAAFLALPESLLYNDYVSGAILGGTIVFVSAVVRLAHPHGDVGQATGSDR